MTIFGRDASHYDPDTIDFAGLSFFTHKASEGTTNPDVKYGAHMAAARAAKVPVLGSYHVLRTPGSGGAGSLAAQLAYWVARQDAETPWWRTHPHWVMQVDAERWQYDQVSPANVLAFASLLARSGLPGWKVTYASRGQYGDRLKGIATPLWNASYGHNTGTYPGDDWATGWAPYSGQTPVLLQYASKPYDRNAFRGSLDELLALTGGGTDVAFSAEEELMIVQAAERINKAFTPQDPYTVRKDRGDKATVTEANPLKHVVPTAPAVDYKALAQALAPLLPAPPSAAEVAAELIAQLGTKS